MRGKGWLTDGEKQTIRSLRADNVPQAKIADSIGRPYPTVVAFCWREGIGGGKPREGYSGRITAQPASADASTPAKPRAFSWERT